MNKIRDFVTLRPYFLLRLYMLVVVLPLTVYFLARENMKPLCERMWHHDALSPIRETRSILRNGKSPASR